MSKRPRSDDNRFQGDPAAPNLRDPSQKNDELKRHPLPKHGADKLERETDRGDRS